jgi:predicted solute-binding protein
MITRRGSILSVATASAAAWPDAPSNATATASASSRQYLISSVVARQLTGVNTAPMSWHAQYSVAIS